MKFETLKGLYTAQAKLHDVMTATPRRSPTKAEIETALLVEVGECLQADKAQWCWWKLTQKPVNRDDLLDELADILHFAIEWELMEGKAVYLNDIGIIDSFRIIKPGDYDPDKTIVAAHKIITRAAKAISTFELAAALGYTPDKLVKAYQRKNAENYRRMAEGY